MKIIVNDTLPFNGFAAITIWPFIFVRRDYADKFQGSWHWHTMLRHEAIHGEQQKEMLIIFFYIWYVGEWLIRLFMPGNAYRNISFEREAYRNDSDAEYLKNRSFFSWFKYIRK